MVPVDSFLLWDVQVADTQQVVADTQVEGGVQPTPVQPTPVQQPGAEPLSVDVLTKRLSGVLNSRLVKCVAWALHTPCRMC